MTGTNKKDFILKCFLYIYYLIWFQKSNNNIKALIRFKSKVNTIILIYILKLSFEV